MLLSDLVASVNNISLDDLVKMRNDLDKEIKARAKLELDKLEDTRNQLLGIMGSDCRNPVPDFSPALPKTPALPKYRDPVTGKTWSGKGKRPLWFDAGRADDFLIEAVPHPGDLLTD